MAMSSASSMNLNMETSVVMTRSRSLSRSNSQQLEWALIDAISTIPSRSPPNSFTSGNKPQCLFPSLDRVMEAGVPCFCNATDSKGQVLPAMGPFVALGQAQSSTNLCQRCPVDTIVSTASSSRSHCVPSFGGFQTLKRSTNEQGPNKSAASGIGSFRLFGGMLGIGASTEWRGPTNTTTGIPSLQNGEGCKRGSSPRWQCQAEGCNADISKGLKVLYRRNKLCESCAKSDSLIVKGEEVRFCQQCSSIHPLSEFDGYKRSCRRMLEKHLQLVRRRRAARKAAAREVAAAGTSPMEE